MSPRVLPLGEQRGSHLAGRERSRPLDRFTTSHGIFVVDVYFNAEEASRYPDRVSPDYNPPTMFTGD